MSGSGTDVSPTRASSSEFFVGASDEYTRILPEILPFLQPDPGARELIRAEVVARRGGCSYRDALFELVQIGHVGSARPRHVLR
jgi:hypothetical protein